MQGVGIISKTPIFPPHQLYPCAPWLCSPSRIAISLAMPSGSAVSRVSALSSLYISSLAPSFGSPRRPFLVISDTVLCGDCYRLNSSAVFDRAAQLFPQSPFSTLCQFCNCITLTRPSSLCSSISIAGTMPFKAFLTSII